jgi:hypothetical protein
MMKLKPKEMAFFNPKLSVRHAEGLPLATAEGMNWKTVGTS